MVEFGCTMMSEQRSPRDLVADAINNEHIIGRGFPAVDIGYCELFARELGPPPRAASADE